MHAPPSRRTPLGKAARTASLAAFLWAGCGPAPAPSLARPEPALALSPAAADSFSQLRRRWAGASREERRDARMEAYIRQLRSLYGDEPVARQADLYLAWIAMENGDYERAVELARQAGRPHPGNVQDLAQLIEGATLARSGEPEAALEKLLPLVGRLLDIHARDLLHEEAVIAAVTAQRWQEALRLLDIWMRDVPEDERAAVLSITRALLTQIPSVSLEQELARRMGGAPGPRSELLDKALVRRLGAVAIERRDSALARRLLGRSETRIEANPEIIALLGEAAAEVLELAARTDTPRVTGRRVGLLLPSSPGEPLSRGAQVSLGVLEELGGLGGPGGAASVVARSEGQTAQETRQALAALDVEGVAVLLGGLDPEGAERLADFAEAQRIAALLLVPPSSQATRRWAFVVGPDDQDAAPLALAALSRRGARTIAVVGGSRALVAPENARVLLSVDCTSLPSPSNVHRYPTAEWKAQRVDGLLLLGSARCAEDVIAEAREARLLPHLALGIHAADLVFPLPSGASPTRRSLADALVVGLGCFPELPRPSRSPAAARPPASFARLLARETAKLASFALADLPVDQTLDASEVAKRRERVRALLASAGPSACLGLRPAPSAAASAWRLLEQKGGTPR